MIKQKLKLLITLTLTTILSITMFPAKTEAILLLHSDDYEEDFLKLYDKISNANNGYFKRFGSLKVPYYSKETLLIEPNSIDYGHDTTSETFSYYMLLEAMYGAITGDWSNFKTSWDSTEKFIIPNSTDQYGL